MIFSDILDHFLQILLEKLASFAVCQAKEIQFSDQVYPGAEGQGLEYQLD